MGLSWEQPERTTWNRCPVGPPLSGIDVGVRCFARCVLQAKVGTDRTDSWHHRLVVSMWKVNSLVSLSPCGEGTWASVGDWVIPTRYTLVLEPNFCRGAGLPPGCGDIHKPLADCHYEFPPESERVACTQLKVAEGEALTAVCSCACVLLLGSWNLWVGLWRGWFGATACSVWSRVVFYF